MTHRIIHSDIIKYLSDYQDVMQRGYMPKYHAVICDPPYGIDFMNKMWDKYSPQAYQAWVTEWASLLLDYVYPGGVLMAFGGTRTYHRLVCGLEDAGWEIYDSIGHHTYYTWNYGSGFPKSHDISKAIDNAAGAEREVVGEYDSRGKYDPENHRTSQGHAGLFDNTYGTTNITAPATPEAVQWSGYGSALKPSFEPIVLARKSRDGYTYAECATQFGSGALNIDGCRIATDEDTRRNAAGGDNGLIGSETFKIRERFASEQPLTEGRWPANTMLTHHPACNGTCHPECHVRVLGEQSGERPVGNPNKITGIDNVNYNNIVNNSPTSSKPTVAYADTGTAARFFYQAKAAKWERDAGLDYVTYDKGLSRDEYDTVFSALWEQGIKPVYINPANKVIYFDSNDIPQSHADKFMPYRNPHPTVKPIQLITELAKLCKPPIEDSRILIPFSGSGSEMIGAHLAGWSHITGIEMTDEYIPIARARLQWWQRFNSYAMAEAHYKNHDDSQMTLFEALA